MNLLPGEFLPESSTYVSFIGVSCLEVRFEPVKNGVVEKTGNVKRDWFCVLWDANRLFKR